MSTELEKMIAKLYAKQESFIKVNDVAALIREAYVVGCQVTGAMIEMEAEEEVTESNDVSFPLLCHPDKPNRNGVLISRDDMLRAFKKSINSSGPVPILRHSVPKVKWPLDPVNPADIIGTLKDIEEHPKGFNIIFTPNKNYEEVVNLLLAGKTDLKIHPVWMGKMEAHNGQCVMKPTYVARFSLQAD